MPVSERRLIMARRMPQLNTSRALLFMVGILSLCFGIMAAYTEHQNLKDQLLAENAIGQGSPSSLAIIHRLETTSAEDQRVFIIAGAFGLITTLLARFLYHIPLLGPVLGCFVLIGSAVTIFYYRSGESLPYILASFLALAIYIVAIRAGHQFLESYARMGRSHES